MDEMPTTLVLPDESALETSGEFADEPPGELAADPTDSEPRTEPGDTPDESRAPAAAEERERDREAVLLPSSDDDNNAPLPRDAEPAPDITSEPTDSLCTGAADQEIMHAQPEPALYKWVLTQVQGCFYGLGGSMKNLAVPDDDFHACISDAIEEGLGLTVNCSSCFADIGLCSKHFCTKSCGNVQISENMNLQGCLDCQKKHYCAHTFDKCVGWSMTQDLQLSYN
ncbi:MAG: hypothetical protein CL940_04625 [Deltaproteobacteria bacterium]|nr:hypothetical protein [Deltaproteobacteria bacterium]